jgi:hypothetical protein
MDKKKVHYLFQSGLKGHGPRALLLGTSPKGHRPRARLLKASPQGHGPKARDIGSFLLCPWKKRVFT